MEEPKIEDVFQNIYDLYENPDPAAKERASKWLADFQKSIYSWNLSDQLLQQKKNLHSCYFAAQTMRSKIQHSFHELPESSYDSLRDSIITHIEHITPGTDTIITKQLCLALSNLILLMASWQKPIDDLLAKFAGSPESIQPLLLTLTFIPEEIDARYLRLGDNRRKQVLNDLEASSATVLGFLQLCLMNDNPTIAQRVQLDVIMCFTAWVKMDCLPLGDAAGSAVFAFAFQLLMNQAGSTEKQLDTASDCVCAVLESMDLKKTTPELERTIFEGIMQLERAYQDSVHHEDSDKSMVLCRIFTVVAETYLPRMVNGSTPAAPHYTLKVLDSLISCVGHFDYEVAQITFNVWYKISEELYQKNDDDLTKLFERHVERLIENLYKHCQIEADQEGLIEEEGTFAEFRFKVSELIKDVIFVIKSIKCFTEMFRMLKAPNVTWEATEAALFIMECCARNIYVEEDVIVPQVIEAILQLPENCHIAIRLTSVNLLGQLCDWIAAHPARLDSILNFLLNALQMKAALASAAAQSLQLICSSCHRDMTSHINGLLEIARCLEMFEIQPEAATLLLKGISTIISRLPNEQIANVMRQLCGFQITHINNLTQESGKKKDPTMWIDRLAAIYRHTNPKTGPNEINPATAVIIENWSTLSAAIDCYKHDDKVMERIIRCIRYAIRCISHNSLPILESLVNQMIEVYTVYKHSCLLYLGSVLVDEFGHDNRCIEGLLKMLEAFVQPTFDILNVENGLKNHPDTVDDFFRLAVRFIQRMPLQFLQSPILASILQCATLACTLDHRDANQSVMKFLSNLLAHGKPNGDPDIKPFVQQIVLSHGDTLIGNLLYSSVFYLHPNMLGDVADVFMEVKFISSEVFSGSIQKALAQLPRKNAGGSVTATDLQMTEFYQDVTKANVSTRQMTHALQDFCRLFR